MPQKPPPSLKMKEATAADASRIRAIAEAAWWATYRDILSDAAIEEALEGSYTDEAVAESLEEGQRWLLAENEDGELQGFCATQYFADKHLMFIHKLYIDPERQGSGAGKALLQAARSLEHQARRLQLLVNRANHKAQRFYLTAGFRVKQGVTVIAGPDFLKEDYLMEQQLALHPVAEDTAPATADVA